MDEKPSAWAPLAAILHEISMEMAANGWRPEQEQKTA